jgi:hypothetical protein
MTQEGQSEGLQRGVEERNVQETSLTKLSLREIPAAASKTEEAAAMELRVSLAPGQSKRGKKNALDPMKSVETTASSVYSRMPLRGPSAASLIAALMVS